ncbi:MAG: lipoyl(octanoyl) transferase LipB [Pseudomonadaceae bacterium]|nr:lipoyl(octanoyl) transferase LipB [Pseudomonadaceae bacterium]
MEIIRLPGLTLYPAAMARMDAAVERVLAGGTETLFLLEHDPVFTIGSSGDAATEVLDAGNIPVLPTGRGGKTTYHGPGQLVAYVIKDLRKSKDLRKYIQVLQEWTITTLADLGVDAFTTDDIGVWVNSPDAPAPAKIAAIGVRVRKWVAFHGVAINVNPDLAAFQRIVPCGLAKPVTSLAELGISATLQQVEERLVANTSHCLNSQV